MIDYSKIVTAEDKFEQAKAAKKAEIDQSRDAALAAGFEYEGHVFDSDSKSIQRISAIATLSLLDPTFTTPYITQDNQTITLDALAIAGLGAAAATHEAQHVFKARLLKDAVLAATNRAELDAIQWDEPAA